jgi:multiple sugar transport system permease protein
VSARRAAQGGAAGYLFLAPYLLLFSLFVLLPAVMGLWMSLHDWAFLGQRRWAGLGNYARLFDARSDVGPAFWSSVAHTGLFVLLSVPLLVVLPLGAALAMNARVPGRTLFRAAFFAPSLLGIAVVGVLWRYLLDPQGGLVNATLGRAVPWTTELPWAWVALVGVTLWWTLGFNAVIYLAGLQDIPRELYEAARLDGAGAWARFRHVTLPGLRPVLVLVMTTTLLASANMFGQSYLVTAGAPAHATRTAVMYIAQEGLRSFQLGQAAAMSFVLALLLAALGLACRRVLRPEGP